MIDSPVALLPAPAPCPPCPNCPPYCPLPYPNEHNRQSPLMPGCRLGWKWSKEKTKSCKFLNII
ncbi:hypothetical protein ACJIZ3_009093 [Penstemon smallii]|uniref:Uncharacterized protein n=1 Tax=Penstemon smallii TaxID=265156 RepID=A0ABD3TC21_9LAMI